MSVTGTFAALGRLLRRTPPPPDDVLEAYAHEVVPVMDRAEWLYQYWLEQSTLFTDSEKLGNVAAIHRWETASMGRSLERVIPPAVLASAHESVLDALDMASRAAQLLSSGSRFHNANAICEGQALLVQSRDRRLAALQSMRRYLAAVLDAPANDETFEAHATGLAEARSIGLAEARSTGLTEAAALVSADADAVQAASEQPDYRPAHATQQPADAAEQQPAHTAQQPAHAAEQQPALPTNAAPAAALASTDDTRSNADRASDTHAHGAYDGFVADGFADEDHAEDEDALPWLTRLAEQEREHEQERAAAASAPPTAVPAPAPSPAPAVAPPAHQPTPQHPASAPALPAEPAQPIQHGEQPAPGAGWGSLFRRPAAPPSAPDESAPPRS